MIVGVALGRLAPGFTTSLSKLEFGEGSRVNVAIAVLIWLMIYPMMLKVDFGAIGGVARRPKGLGVTLFVNWLVKPFSMALLGWLFMQHIFAAWITPDAARDYTAGLIILAAAPCTAMVFVWSYLTDGDPAYTLVQVALNDLIMLVAFVPIVGLLVSGASNLTVPYPVLLYSVLAFIVIPLALGGISRALLIKRKGRDWFEGRYLPFFHPLTIAALLATLVLIFAFQAENITRTWSHVLLIAVPIAALGPTAVRAGRPEPPGDPLPWRVGGDIGFTVDAAAFPDSAGAVLEVYVRLAPATLMAISGERPQEIGRAHV